MRAANEGALRTALAQGIGQSQAAHDVASADLQRGVGAECELHQRLSVQSLEATMTNGALEQAHHVTPLFTLFDRGK